MYPVFRVDQAPQEEVNKLSDISQSMTGAAAQWTVRYVDDVWVLCVTGYGVAGAPELDNSMRSMYSCGMVVLVPSDQGLGPNQWTLRMDGWKTLKDDQICGTWAKQAKNHKEPIGNLAHRHLGAPEPHWDINCIPDTWCETPLKTDREIDFQWTSDFSSGVIPQYPFILRPMSLHSLHPLFPRKTERSCWHYHSRGRSGRRCSVDTRHWASRYGNQAWCGWGRQLISFQMGFTTFNKQNLGLHQDQ